MTEARVPVTDDALVEKVARAMYCADEKMDAPSNESHLGCYFQPFNEYATDDTRVMMDDYRAMARAAIAIAYPAGVAAGREAAAKVAEENAASSVPLMNGLGVAALIETGRYRAATEITAAIRQRGV